MTRPRDERPGAAAHRTLWALAGSLLLFAVLVAGGLLYTSWGPPTRDLLITQMLINAIMVVGLQVYIGNTGVLSFGHVGFGGIAGYAFAVFAISADRKERLIPDAPFGLAGVDMDPAPAFLCALAVTLVVGAIVGLGLARSGARSGAVAATVITLALLLGVHEVGINWTDLTGGDRAGLSFSIGDTLKGRSWIYAGLLASILAARLFAQSRLGRLAKAAREDDLAARAMGVNPAVQQMAALLLSVAIVAVSASLRVYQLGTVTPKFFFFDYTLLILAMLIVGGRKSVTGAICGVAVMTAGNELTRHLADPDVGVTGLGWLLRDGLSDIFLGGAMLGFMIFRTAGLLDDWEIEDWLRRRWRRDRPAPAADARPGPAPDGTLAVDDATVAFGGFRALDGACLRASSREVVGLIGPNGAGKTTLLNVITGLVEPDAGRCRLDSVELRGAPAHVVARAGLARTFQNLRLFPALTVRENVEVVALVAARHRRRSSPSAHASPSADLGGEHRPGAVHRGGRAGGAAPLSRGGRADPSVLLAVAGLWDQRHRRALELDYGRARRLELARAAALAPAFMLLDEPTSGMSDAESVAMIDVVRSVAAVAGAGVVVIDHDLAFITGICDRIYCLDQGRVIAQGSPAEMQADPLVQAAYLGSATPAQP